MRTGGMRARERFIIIIIICFVYDSPERIPAIILNPSERCLLVS